MKAYKLSASSRSLVKNNSARISLYAITLPSPALSTSTSIPQSRILTSIGSKGTTDAMAETIETSSQENITFTKRLKQ
jgi:hypothetical protein